MEHDRPLASEPGDDSPPAHSRDDSDEIPVFDRYGNQVPAPTFVEADAHDHARSGEPDDRA